MLQILSDRLLGSSRRSDAGLQRLGERRTKSYRTSNHSIGNFTDRHADRRYDYLESDTWQVRKRNGSIQRHRTKSTGPLSPVSIRHDFVGSCREHRTGNEPWWPARIKVRTPGPRALVSLMVANAVTVVAEEATLGGSTSLLWREGNASAWPNVLTLPVSLD